jgi:two-component system response regulator MtrA
MHSPTVLVVEDDARIASIVADQLREEEFRVVTARNAREAAQALIERRPDVVLLDVMLPDGSGFELCRRIRRGGDQWDSGVGIVLLTARVEDVDVLRGFERGADDYVRKPFALPELVARVRAVVARRRRSTLELLRVGELVIDVAGRAARLGDVPLDLAGKEFAMLVELASDPGAVRTKQELLQRVWGSTGLRTRTVDSHASRLRRKLIDAGATGDPIVNSWGRGYRLDVARA